VIVNRIRNGEPCGFRHAGVEFLSTRVARWWLPDQWTFISEVPKTSVGKFDKKVMRAAYADGEYKVQSTPLPK